MKKIEPTHKEIMKYLDCGLYSKYHKGQCMCYTKENFSDCYENAKRFLTKMELDAEEIRALQEKNTKAMEELKKALNDFYEL